MCQAKVVLEHGDERELILEDVIHLRVDGNKIWLSRFFEDPISYHASIKEADFLDHTIVLTAHDDTGGE